MWRSESANSVIEQEPPLAAESGGKGERSQVEEAVKAAERYLRSLQHADGHWCAELEGDTILESEYLLGLCFLGRLHEERARKAANYLREKQLEDGGWAIYPGGPPEVSASVKAYFVLKLMGDDAAAPHMEKARRVILRLGGLDACNSFTKLYLSMFGQYDWWAAPAVPPELVLLPRWFYINIYAMSSWSRAIVVPLAIIWAHKPNCPVAPSASLAELRTAVTPAQPELGFRERFWSAFFIAVDRMLKVLESLRLIPFRRWALARAEAWIRERLADSDGLGAIFPSILNTVIAFRCLGYDSHDPLFQSQVHELEKLEIEEGDTLRLQPCFSPVWDTSLAVTSLLEIGCDGEDEAVKAAVKWLLDKEVRRPGDWQVKNPQGPVGGWFFEYRNEFYPDCDDTAEILAALGQLRFEDSELEARRRGALKRALGWQLSMQNRDGGWGAFDRGCDRELLTLVPFADHNAMIDPSTADITARTLEALACCDFDRSHPAVSKALAFLYREQEKEGSWYGRWGANYLYGTWLALSGLKAIGEDMGSVACRRAVEWLLGCQNDDGGWGESLRSYDDPGYRGRGESTAAQTAWAMMGLVAAQDRASSSATKASRPDAEAVSAALRRGARFLLTTQRDDGSWLDENWTATGFPKVFYLRYHLYASYFPLQALAMYRKALELGCGVNRAA